MTSWYLDTSAAIKLIQREAESEQLIAEIHRQEPTLMSSRLLETELRRAIQRSSSLEQRDATELLERIDLYDVTPMHFTQAGLLPGRNLRSLDAIHVAVALSLQPNTVVTYDIRMAEVSRDAGLQVIAPA
ncbi:MAG: type II toxin-antitoxin system VapC family toxin [Ancrocorticia sp.]